MDGIPQEDVYSGGDGGGGGGPGSGTARSGAVPALQDLQGRWSGGIQVGPGLVFGGFRLGLTFGVKIVPLDLFLAPRSVTAAMLREALAKVAGNSWKQRENDQNSWREVAGVGVSLAGTGDPPIWRGI